VDEVEESKITGEEERYSKLDLPTFLANLEGARVFYESLEPIVEAKDPELNQQINDAFDAAFKEVNGLKQDGRFPAYDELSEAQQRAVKQDIEALAEPLARVQGTLGVKS
jgi:iron uptake system component EfeO